MSDENNQEEKNINVIGFSILDFDRREVVIDLEKKNIIQIHRETHNSSE